MSETQGLFASAIAAAKEAGQTVGADENIDITTTSSEETVPESQDILDMDFGGISDAEEESGDPQEASISDEENPEDSSHEAQDEKISDEEFEFITVTDHHDRRRKVKVDYSDKDNIKKAFSMAAGARKWQAERDSLKKELDSFKETSGKKVENWDSISSVYEKQGIQGLVNFLEGSEEAFEKLVDRTIQEREWKNTASPEELELHRYRQEQAQKESEVEKLRRELEDIKNTQLSAKEEAELSTLKAEINPVFDKYRFSGKLNNPVHEEMLDDMLWTNAMKQLEDLPDEASITPTLVNKVFRNYANNLRTLVNKQAEQKASQTIQKKKRQATETVQVKASKSLNNKGAVTAKDLIKEGRIGDLFRAAAARNKNFIK